MIDELSVIDRAYFGKDRQKQLKAKIEALAGYNKPKVGIKVAQLSKVDFSIGARAHDRYGRQVWMP